MSNVKLPNGMELVFAPGCFDNFEGTQEELDELIKEITDKFASGEALEEARALSPEELLESLTEEEVDSLIRQLESDVSEELITSVTGRRLQ
jgi:Mg/Co/Ni transporter MgtE